MSRSQNPRIDHSRWITLLVTWVAWWAGMYCCCAGEQLRLIILDPGHFHAALFQKEHLPGIAPSAHVYAPLGPDLLAHLERVSQFNSRPLNPTRWQLDIHAGPDFLQKLWAERPGDVVVLSGRNRDKIGRIQEAARHGLHILADKPWIIEPEDFPKLEAALAEAERGGVVAYDAMTQRYEISCILQKELVNDPEVFGQLLPGSPEAPGVSMQSLHYIFKEVAGAPIRRPAWFFDIAQQGEALADVGTHLVDLVTWTLFQGQCIDWQRNVHVESAARWPTAVTLEQFRRATGEREFPAFLRPAVRLDGSQARLSYFCNNSVTCSLRGIWIRLDAEWQFAPPEGARDSALAVFRGSQCEVQVRQGVPESFRPEVYVVARAGVDHTALGRALQTRVALLQGRFAGIGLAEVGQGRWRMLIPEAHRVGHEEHFALLVRQFLKFVRDPASLPAWEKLNMLAKYQVTTRAIALARASGRGRPPSTPIE
jgi:predicted dehydrogenase